MDAGQERQTMKKIVLIVIGSLAGVYSAAAIVQMVWTLVTRNPASARGASDIAATVSIAALCVGVCAVCFQKALCKPKSGGDSR
jgi:flagellar basal body-associated protein FliL